MALLTELTKLAGCGVDAPPCFFNQPFSKGFLWLAILRVLSLPGNVPVITPYCARNLRKASTRRLVVESSSVPPISMGMALMQEPVSIVPLCSIPFFLDPSHPGWVKERRARVRKGWPWLVCVTVTFQDGGVDTSGLAYCRSFAAAANIVVMRPAAIRISSVITPHRTPYRALPACRLCLSGFLTGEAPHPQQPPHPILRAAGLWCQSVIS